MEETRRRTGWTRILRTDFDGLVHRVTPFASTFCPPYIGDSILLIEDIELHRLRPCTLA